MSRRKIRDKCPLFRIGELEELRISDGLLALSARQYDFTFRLQCRHVPDGNCVGPFAASEARIEGFGCENFAAPGRNEHVRKLCRTHDALDRPVRCRSIDDIHPASDDGVEVAFPSSPDIATYIPQVACRLT